MTITLRQPRELIRLQGCADRLQAVVEQQADVLHEIQQCDYVPSPEKKARLDALVIAYDNAVSDYEEASAECDAPVYVKVRRRR
jgi:hypothetical protein